MPPDKAKVTNASMRKLPSVDELIRSAIGQEVTASAGERHVASLARRSIDSLRQKLEKVEDDRSKENIFTDAENSMKNLWYSEQMTGTKRVINATGVIIHTNLGRAVLSDNAQRALVPAAGYCTLEYDVETGKRGRRGSRAETLINEMTGAEGALIVNNCAAAAFFVLTAFASGGEVVISRGELVEIGGDFRVPDVLCQSGGTLREVGTTNRTKLADYEKAIDQTTKLILRVHPSNYRIVGFTATPTVAELAALAHKHGILFYEDLGSGALIDLSEFGLDDEPVVSHSIAAGVDVVSFSGDKLLGGPQAGIIAGKREIIEFLRQHPLYRALRVDKLAYAALEATLESYRRGSASTEVPVLAMLSLTKDQIAKRVSRFTETLNIDLGEDSDLHVETVDGVSAIGGGAAPAVQLETKLIALTKKNCPRRDSNTFSETPKRRSLHGSSMIESSSTFGLLPKMRSLNCWRYYAAWISR